MVVRVNNMNSQCSFDIKSPTSKQEKIKTTMPLPIRITIGIFALVATIFSSQASPNASKLLHQVKYQGKYEGMKITVTRTLTQLGGQRYRLSSKTKSFIGSFEEHEEFFWFNDQTIQPVAYRYKQRMFGISRKRSIDYNWENKTARYKYKGKNRTIPLSDGILGPMTYQLKFQIDLLQEQKTFDYRFIQRGKIKHYKFKRLGSEQITSKKRTITNAIAFVRDNEDKKRKTKIWFNQNDQYTLASLKQTKGKKSHQIFLTSSQYYPLDNTPLESFTETLNP